MDRKTPTSIRVTVVVGLLLATASVGHAQVSFERVKQDLLDGVVYRGGWDYFVGGGVATFDCDGDGLPDLFAAGGEGSASLLHNVSARDGQIRFEVLSIGEILGVTGAYPLDIDGDGALDLVALRNGENLILRGDGACHFTPAPAEWGFDGGDEWTTAFSATFERGQNWPTLAFGNYVDQTNPRGPFMACDKNYLIRPEGRSFGPRQALEPGFCALSMLISDWKRNGQPDLRIANDRQYYVRNGREQMWHLDPLSEYTEADGWPTMMLWGMGIGSRDLTGDGLPEVVITSMGDQMMMINDGDGKMHAAPYSIGTYAARPYLGDDGRPSTGWHAEFGDLNNDGFDDLFIAKGNVDQMPSNPIHDPNNLLIQKPDGTFEEMGQVTGVGTTDRSRGAALADLNGDGRLDIIVANRRAPLEVWTNTTADAGRWLAINLRLEGANRRAVGAIVELRLDDGRVLTQENTIGGGHASGEALPLHFGLGASNTATIRVIWPDGSTSEWVEVAAGATIEVSPGQSGKLVVGGTK